MHVCGECRYFYYYCQIWSMHKAAFKASASVNYTCMLLGYFIRLIIQVRYYSLSAYSNLWWLTTQLSCIEKNVIDLCTSHFMSFDGERMTTTVGQLTRLLQKQVRLSFNTMSIILNVPKLKRCKVITYS